MKNLEFKANKCECCEQTTNYLVSIDRGTIEIMKKIARAIEKKGVNCIHLVKEDVLNHSELCNIVRPRYHGLLAHKQGLTGNFALTRKGLDFLNGKPIQKYAVVSKVNKCLESYYEPEKFQVSISSFNKEDEYWEGVGYDISEGKVIKN